MAAEIKQEYPETKVRLVEGSGGVFEVTVDGDLIFSKKELGRHANEGEVIGLMKERYS